MPQQQSRIIYNSACEVLNEKGYFKKRPFKQVEKHNEEFIGAVVIDVVLGGSVSGFVSFAYSTSFVVNLMNFVDGEAISALMYISAEIASGIGKRYAISCEIGKPYLTKRLKLRPDERVALDTGMGIIEIDVSVF